MDISAILEAGIREHLPEKYKNIRIFSFGLATSTNELALEYAKGEWDGSPAIFVADGQTKGRGRLGRRFVSPSGNGVYLSILTPTVDITPVGVTTYAAVSVAGSTRSIYGVTPGIKWVNDLYLGGKKLAGILTQGVVRDGRVVAAVMGVGINLFGEIEDAEIKEIATTIEAELRRINSGDGKQLFTTPETNKPCLIEPLTIPEKTHEQLTKGTWVENRGVKMATREEFIAKIVENYLDNIHSVGTHELAEEYRRLSFLIGKDVNVITPDTTYPAHIIGINDACELILRMPDGSEKILATGEVSVRELR